ncbi:PIN domain-containing protein [Streptomyces sp. CC208A]|uniref:type II toxin-antitoxin system VapC family toxin n=1 Tax=Streptomyces sp. CC208A TaxID=3044573 RepID=UPI0024A9A7EA|nr:PIN domain-containing protein [Streptomyces sp. CC208A]
MIATVLDTGPLVAFFNAKDKHHSSCVAFFSQLRGRKLLPATVLAEVSWQLERWPRVEAAFVEHVAQGFFELVSFSSEDLLRVSELITQYADFPLGAVDASVIAVAERHEVDRIATLDHRHFRAVKPKHVPALTLLP